MNYIKLSWRNLWRNRRRTLITVASIFFGVVLSTLMSSMMNGTYQNMIDMMVKISTGYIQVQDPSFGESRSVNDVFYPQPELIESIDKTEEVTVVAKRLESFALFSSGADTRGGAVIGIEPQYDTLTSNLRNWVSEGSFLESGGKGVLVTSNIARSLNLGVNDTIIVISQGYRGVTSAGLFPVTGIIEFSTPQMNNLGVFMDVGAAQELFHADSMVTSLMIMVSDYTHVNRISRKIKDLAPGLSVKDWTELNPDLVNFIEGDRSSGNLMIGILYMVIGFGILGTIIMMVAERKKELAVMTAVGMRKYKLSLMFFIETLLIGLIGVISGFAASIPLIGYFVNNPIRLPGDMAEAYLQYGFDPYMFFSAAPSVFINQAIIIFVIAMAISLYPVLKVKKMSVAHSLKS
ncbi:MAG: ABC transporter permease [Bacteroidales bacterium]|nr:ABC transporter permease [Bacteroidales bacterium]MDD4638456.1 ABC transporter permease [Bacteroidales bacterium]